MLDLGAGIGMLGTLLRVRGHTGELTLVEWDEAKAACVSSDSLTVKHGLGAKIALKNRKDASGAVLRSSCRMAPHMPQQLVERKHAFVR